jgi:hypothetical protein
VQLQASGTKQQNCESTCPKTSAVASLLCANKVSSVRLQASGTKQHICESTCPKTSAVARHCCALKGVKAVLWSAWPQAYVLNCQNFNVGLAKTIYIYTVCIVIHDILAGKSPNVRSYTVWIYVRFWPALIMRIGPTPEILSCITKAGIIKACITKA